MALERPAKIRLQGRIGATAAVFDLGAVENDWTLYLPQQREVVREQKGVAAGPLGSPQDMILALLPDQVDKNQLWTEGAWSREGGVWRLVVPPGAGSPYHRVIVISHATGLPSEVILREKTQLEAPLLTVKLGGYKKHQGIWFPELVHISSEFLWGSLEFSSVKLNEELDPRRFTVRVPPGVTEVSAELLDSGFLPEEESR